MEVVWGRANVSFIEKCPLFRSVLIRGFTTVKTKLILLLTYLFPLPLLLPPLLLLPLLPLPLLPLVALLQIFVIKSNKFSDENMVNTLKAESDILSRIPAHTNITTFLGAVLEEEQAKDGAQRHCRLMMELAERELRREGEEGGR